MNLNLKLLFFVFILILGNSCEEKDDFEFDDIMLDNSTSQLQFSLNKYIDDSNLYHSIDLNISRESEDFHQKIQPELKSIYSNEKQFILLLTKIENLKQKITGKDGNKFVFNDTGKNKIKKIAVTDHKEINHQNLRKEISKLGDEIKKCGTKMVNDFIKDTSESNYEDEKSFFYKPVTLNYFRDKKAFVKALDKNLVAAEYGLEALKSFIINLSSIDVIYNDTYTSYLKTEKDYLIALTHAQVDLLVELENFNSLTMFRSFGCYADYRFTETQILTNLPPKIKANTTFDTEVFLTTYDKFQAAPITNCSHPIDRVYAGKTWINIIPGDKDFHLSGNITNFYGFKSHFDTLISVQQ